MRLLHCLIFFTIMLAPIMLSAQTSTTLRDQHVIEDRGTQRTFEIARDELAVVDANGQSQVQPQAAAASAEAARTRAVALKGDLVVYEAGKPRSESTRRIARRQIAARLQPGADSHVIAAATGLRVIGAHPSAAGFILFEATDSGAALTSSETLRARADVVSAEPQLARQQQKRFVPNDTLFAQQWHLQNTGQGSGVADTDVNVVTMWDSYQGAGIRIGIVDDGLQTAHPDLSANVDSTNDHDWNDGTPDNPNPVVSADFHGTSCAGVAAARGNNGLGVSGAAPEATLVGLRLIGAATTDSQEAEALGWKNDIIQIKSNSWGPADDGLTLEAPGSLTAAALQAAVTSGRGGRGTIFLWAGGNGGHVGDNSNYDGYANNIHTIAIAALANNSTQAYYSEPGANLIVTAPSSSNGATLGIVTTDLTGANGYNTGSVSGELTDNNYTNDFGGTSSATPLAAGCVALMLQANPNLGWRDVREILIATAKKVNPTDADWITNGGGFHFNHKFGAGLIDTSAAVAAALTHANLGTHRSTFVTSSTTTSIPDNNATGITRSFAFTSATVSRVEHVTVKLNVTNVPAGQLDITLTSPSGTVSRLSESHSDTSNLYTNWTFSTVRNWGENPNGSWTLKVADRKAGTTGSLTFAEVTVFGSDGTTVNSAPSVALTAPTEGQLFAPGVAVDLNATASDLTATGATGTVTQVEFFNGTSSLGIDTTAPYALSWTPPADGAYALAAKATDSEGAVGISAAINITVGIPPAELLVEDFADASSGDNTTTSGSATAWAGNTNFPTVLRAYEAGSAVKLGTSSGTGSITSRTLDLSGNGGSFSVRFDVKGWTTVEGNITVSVTGLASQTATYTATRTDSFETKTLNFTGGTPNSTVTLATTAKRAFVDNVSVFSQTGSDVAPTVTTGTATSITGTSAILAGTITAIGAANATERGIYWSTTNGFANGAGTKVATSGSFGTGTFAETVSGLAAATTYYFKAFATGAGGTGYGSQGSFTTAGSGSTPTLALSGAALSAFSTTFGTASASQSFTVSGSNLISTVTVTAPSGYEVATTAGGTYAASLSLTPSAGSLVTTSVFARLSATATGSPAGDITVASSGAIAQVKAVSGTVITGGGGGTTALLAGWDFQTPTNGGTAVAAAPNTPTSLVANFGSGTLYLNGTNGASTWVTATSGNELSAFGGTAVNAGTGFSSSTSSPASLALIYNGTNGKSAVFKVNMTGLKDLVVSYATQRTSAGFTTQAWDYSTNGTSWTSVTALTSIPTSFATQTLPTITGLDGAANAYLRLIVSGATTTAGNNRLDNIQLMATSATASGPVIATGGALTTVSTTYGIASPSPASFTIAGTNLTAGITVTPPAGFELSTTSASAGYAGSGAAITIGAAGNVSTTTVHVRLASTAAVGTYAGNLVCSSAGATAVNVATVSSTVAPAALTITAVDAARVYGTANPTFVLSYNGFTNGDTVAVLTSTPTATTTAVLTSSPGAYPITITGGSAANYTLAYVSGELTVSAAPLAPSDVVFHAPANLLQDGSPKVYTVSSAKAQSFSLSYRGRNETRYGPASEAPIAAGDYTLTATSTDVNYEGSASLDFTIVASMETFAQWLADHPGLADTSPSGDAETDGLPNLIEFFMGLNPGSNDGASATVVEKVGNQFSLVYRRSKSAIGVTGAVTWTSDLTTPQPWSSAGIVDVLVSDEGAYEIRRASVTVGISDTVKFMHLEVTQP